MTLLLSLQASYAAPLILLAQNRQADRDRVSLDEDRARNDRSIADTEYLTREVASIRIALGDMATRDFIRGELQRLLERVDERRRRGRRGRLRLALYGRRRRWPYPCGNRMAAPAARGSAPALPQPPVVAAGCDFRRGTIPAATAPGARRASRPCPAYRSGTGADLHAGHTVSGTPSSRGR